MSSENETSDVAQQTEQRAESDQLATTRRNAAKFFAALGGAAAVGTFAVSGLTGLYSSAGLGTGPDYNYKNLYVEGTHLVDSEGNRVGVDALDQGSGDKMTVFPEKEGGGALDVGVATTLLLRFTEDDFEDPTLIDGTVQGYVAYSAVCTHAGCTVSGREGEDLHCPCHGSVFDPTAGAKVVGGPAPRALPQLPIGVTQDGNLLMATGRFEGPIGAE